MILHKSKEPPNTGLNLIDSESNQPSEPAAKTRCKVNKITKVTSLNVLEGWEPKQDVKLTSIK